MYTVNARFQVERIVVNVRAGYGEGGDAFPAWNYGLDAYGGSVHAGYVFPAGRALLSVWGGSEVWRVVEIYERGDERDGFAFAPGVGAELICALDTWLAFAISVDAGILFAPGAGREAGDLTSAWMRAGVAPVISF
jgi:hypothetical protein